MRVQVTYTLPGYITKIIVPLVQELLAPGASNVIRKQIEDNTGLEWERKENGHYFISFRSIDRRINLQYEVVLLAAAIEISLLDPRKEEGRRVIAIYKITREVDQVMVTEQMDGMSDNGTVAVGDVVFILTSLVVLLQKEVEK